MGIYHFLAPHRIQASLRLYLNLVAHQVSVYLCFQRHESTQNRSTSPWMVHCRVLITPNIQFASAQPAGSLLPECKKAQQENCPCSDGLVVRVDKGIHVWCLQTWWNKPKIANLFSFHLGMMINFHL